MTTTTYYTTDHEERGGYGYASRWPIFYRAGKDIPKSETYPHHRIVVTAGLHAIGDQAPYWSITGEIINKRQRRDDDIESCGSIHKDIAEQFPELAPVIALHLSDRDGVPMHAVANGAYWLGLTGSKRAQVRVAPDKGLEDRDLPWLPYVESHFRITHQEAKRLVRELRTTADVEDYVETQRPRWARESLDAAQLLASLAA